MTAADKPARRSRQDILSDLTNAGVLDSQDIVYTVDEASAILAIDRTTLTKRYKAGEISGFNMGDRVYFTRADLRQYITHHRASCPARTKEGSEPISFRPRRLNVG